VNTGVGRGEQAPTWKLKFFAKKGYFLTFESEKTNFATFAPLEKFRKNPVMAPLEKILPTPMSVK